jgi:hypothetical protein
MNWWLNVKKEATKWAVILIVGIIAGLTLGWTLWSPKKVKTEKAAPAVIQADGSVQVRVDPGAPAEPKQIIPPGAKVNSIQHIQVNLDPLPVVPTTTPGSTGTEAPAKPSNEHSKVSVDLTDVTMPDGSHRVIASSPDGKIDAGASIDIPAPAEVAKKLTWAVGYVQGITPDGDKAIGAFIDHDMAFVRLGAEVTKNTYHQVSQSCWEVRAKIGICF